jgi:uncharacterized membrane protein YeaQ/YmgE (transglycosylase-associated protein family)
VVEITANLGPNHYVRRIIGCARSPPHEKANMELLSLLIKLGIAIACALIGKALLTRTSKGGFGGLILLGFMGIYLGEWGDQLLRERLGLNVPALQWQLVGVQILPALAGSLVIIFLVYSFMDWARLNR